MSGVIGIVSKVLPIIFLIIGGNILQRLKFFKEDTTDELKKIVVNVSLPALLFTAFAETSFQPKYLLIIVVVFLVCGLMLVVGRLFQKVFKSENKYFPTLYSGFEAGMMGYSIFVAVYGVANMYKFAIIDIGQVTFVFFVLVSYLHKLNGNSSTPKELIVSFIKSPVIISIISGIIFGTLGIVDVIKSFSLTNSVYETLKLVSTLTVPLICIIIGYELKISLKGLKLSVVTAVSRVAVLFIIAAFINSFIMERILHVDRVFQAALYTMFILPPPFIIPIFMKQGDGKDKQLILNAISVNIVLSLIVYLVFIAAFKV